jgi:hypothetical protein
VRSATGLADTAVGTVTNGSKENAIVITTSWG